jgi:hypothetical protein
VERNPLSQHSFHLPALPKEVNTGLAARAETPGKRKSAEWQPINVGTAKARRRRSRRIDFMVIIYGDPCRSRKRLAPLEGALVKM